MSQETPTPEVVQPPVPDWLVYVLGDTTAIQAIFWLVLICIVLALAKKVWPSLTQFVQIMNAVAGLPSHIEKTEEHTVKTDRRYADLEEKIDGIYHETHKNDGSSVKDAVDRIEEEVKKLAEELRAADQQLRVDLEDTLPAQSIKPE